MHGVHRSPRYLGSLVRAKPAREARPIWVGEPMLHKSIDRIVERAVSRGISVERVPSGFRVKERVEELAKRSSIVVSVDGPEPIDDLNRGQGTFAVAM
ncbi:hypothetical protein WME79_36360 [Sorangium sp. So ce726]|uniref:hypothetical protein n=1 Tax=Sorangium sp. So ce726 TaxID=3133319 RepID=UPI003F5DE3A0